MVRSQMTFGRRGRLLGATALALVFADAARAQVPNNTIPSGIPADAGISSNKSGSGAHAQSGPANNGGNSAVGPVETVTVKAQRQLLREKNSPSAVTELGAQQIAQTGVQGSVATLLRAAPSVYVYQQGIGDNEPVFSIRGARGLEVASTLDGVPMQDLLSGGSGSYLNGIVGGPFNLDQISGVSLYPGVAYPDKSTFGTIGGTIAYDSLRPTNQMGGDVFGSIGSFGTYNEGFDLNSGRMDGWMGTGVDAPKMMLKYSNLQTSGYYDYTPARYNNMEFAFDKPYDQGLSLFQATVLYNTGNAYVLNEPIPEPYLEKNGDYSNYSPDEEFNRTNSDYFSLILKNDTYINDYLSAGLTTFYRYSDTDIQTYANPTLFAPNGENGSAGVDGANPFNQTVAGFGEQGDYGYGNVFYQPGAYDYNPNTSINCPASVSKSFAAAGQTSPCGYNAQYSKVHTDTYGLQPRLTITPPDIWGIRNTIKIGALVAKETEPAEQTYVGSTPDFPHDASDLITTNGTGYDGGTQRTIYQGYAQDKIDLIDNTLHLTPGVTLEGTDSSLVGSEVQGATPTAATLATAYCQTYTCDYGPYKVHKWDREWLPFMNVAYDLDKILPAARGVSIYASYATSALFAPTTDFVPNSAGESAPSASIVHMYEAGIKYNRNNLSLSLDYFYQHIERDFGFFEYQSGPMEGDYLFSNDGQREMKGVEGSAIWQVTPHWQLFANFSHVLDKYLATDISSVTVQEDQYGLAIKGTAASGVPDWLSTFGVDYHTTHLWKPADDLNVRLEGQYTGQQYSTYDLTGTENVGAIPGFEPYGTYDYYNGIAGDTLTNPYNKIPAFVTFNLDMNYKLPIRNAGPLKTLDFDLNVLNLFNAKYIQYLYKQISPSSCGTFTSGPYKGQAISNYGCSAEYGDALYGEPFAITFSIKAHF